MEATNLARRLKLSPHISTTYISADELSCAGVSCVSSGVHSTDVSRPREPSPAGTQPDRAKPGSYQ